MARTFPPQIVYTPAEADLPILSRKGQTVTIYRDAALTTIESNLQLADATPVPSGVVTVDATSRTPRLRLAGDTVTLLYAKPGASALVTPIFADAEEVLAAIASAYVPATVGPTASGDTTGATDFAALQAWLNLSTGGSPKRLVLPRGTYFINVPLVMPVAAGTTIEGAGRLATIIKQVTNNTPVVTFTSEFIHSLKWKGIQFGYVTQQTSAQTSGTCWLFNVTGGVGGGWWNWQLDDVQFSNCSRGIAIAGSGSLPLWAWRGTSVSFNQVALSAMDFTSPTAIGMPQNQWTDTVVDNTGGAVVSAGPAIVGAAAEGTFLGLRVEGWYNTIFSYSGANNGPTIRGVHIEHCTFSSVGATTVFQIANSPSAVIEDVNMAGSVLAACTELYVVKALSGAKIKVRGIAVATTNAGGTTTYLGDTDGTAGAEVLLSSVTATTATVSKSRRLVENTDTSTPALAVVPASGRFSAATLGTLTNITFALQDAHVVPIFVEKAGIATALSINVATAQVGSSALLGIFTDSGSGLPSKQIDFVSVATTATGIVTGTFASPIPLPRGLYWLAYCAQGTTAPQVAASAATTRNPWLSEATLAQLFGANAQCFHATGQAVLPSTFPAVIVQGAGAPLIAVSWQ